MSYARVSIIAVVTFLCSHEEDEAEQDDLGQGVIVYLRSPCPLRSSFVDVRLLMLALARPASLFRLGHLSQLTSGMES